MEDHRTGAVRLELHENGRGKFWFDKDGTQAGEMVFSITGHVLTVYHTEVRAEHEGKGIAGRLLEAMVAYAYAHQLNVYPLCPYVLAQFQRHPETYNAIWLKELRS